MMYLLCEADAYTIKYIINILFVQYICILFCFSYIRSCLTTVICIFFSVLLFSLSLPLVVYIIKKVHPQVHLLIMISADNPADSCRTEAR